MLRVVQLELNELNDLVEKWHRHHKRVQGHRFSFGVMETKTGEIVGGCSVGRPVSRYCDPKTTLEVTRLVTDGTKNACSFMYAAAARIGRELGYEKIQTYILDEEDGTSLTAAGWQFEANTQGGQWVHTDDNIVRRKDQPTQPKQRWVKYLRKE
jgi:hypothetical protein